MLQIDTKDFMQLVELAHELNETQGVANVGGGKVTWIEVYKLLQSSPTFCTPCPVDKEERDALITGTPLFWHTHPGMMAQSSGADDKTYNAFMEAYDRFFTLIVNDSLQYELKYWQSEPFAQTVPLSFEFVGSPRYINTATPRVLLHRDCIEFVTEAGIRDRYSVDRRAPWSLEDIFEQINKDLQIYDNIFMDEIISEFSLVREVA